MKRLLSAALPLALLCAFPAFAATLTATDLASARAKVASAQTGDHVQLQAGTYALDLWNIVRTGEVVIEPAPGAAVNVTEINATGSAFLTFRGFTVIGNGVDVEQAHDIVLDGLTIRGADCATLVGAGVWLRNLPAKSNVIIRNSEISCVRTGIGGLDFDGLAVEGNTLHDIQTDGIFFTGVTNVAVRNNTGSNFHTAGGGHPDFIQLANTATTSTAHVVISGNRYERGSGDVAQGIFVEGGLDISIHDNALRGTMYNGISLAGTKSATIDHNFVQGYPDMDTRIIVRGGCDSVSITNNTTQAAFSYVTSTEPPCTNVTLANNTIIPAAAKGDYTLPNAWSGSVAPVPAPTPAPVPAPTPTPAVNPLQATVDSLTAQVADLTAQLTAAKAANVSSLAQVASLTTQLQAANAQIATLKTQLAAATAKITKGRAALK